MPLLLSRIGGMCELECGTNMYPDGIWKVLFSCLPLLLSFENSFILLFLCYNANSQNNSTNIHKID
jgi:hypothetical protein